jgi:negative regulator of flagellin synthesis FlgM
MNVKINDIRQYGAISNYKKTNDQRPVSSTGKKTSPKDEVQISTEAKQLASQYTSHAATEERAEVIRRLKESVSNQTYQVDSELLAERMIHYFKSISKSGE